MNQEGKGKEGREEKKGISIRKERMAEELGMRRNWRQGREGRGGREGREDGREK
jgi:hypothetical protein